MSSIDVVRIIRSNNPYAEDTFCYDAWERCCNEFKKYAEVNTMPCKSKNEKDHKEPKDKKKK